MVLWEITVVTAYFLGLRRTYRLALKIQRRLVGPKNPKVREFLKRRTRTVFDVALSVHRNIQHRDIEAGRNLGNWILRCLDRIKPSAQIRGPPELISEHPPVPKFTNQQQTGGQKLTRNDSDGRVLSSIMSIRLPKSSPTVGTILRKGKSAGSSGAYSRFLSNYPETQFQGRRHGGVFRDDIALWMKH